MARQQHCQDGPQPCEEQRVWSFWKDKYYSFQHLPLNMEPLFDFLTPPCSVILETLPINKSQNHNHIQYHQSWQQQRHQQEKREESIILHLNQEQFEELKGLRDGTKESPLLMLEAKWNNLLINELNRLSNVDSQNQQTLSLSTHEGNQDFR